MTTLLLALTLAADPGIRPLGSDGKPLNLNFETGTLQDWTAQGEAFRGQPIEGDTVAARRGDMKSQHEGKFWIGSYEKFGDRAKGTLTSLPFNVAHPWASFLVAGGSSNDTRVEIINATTNEVIFQASGEESETLKRVAVDLTKHKGQSIRIKLVDNSSGPWGHLNFDDFLFHTTKPDVPSRPVAPADLYPFNGQTPSDAAKNMTVPPGFSVSLFAGDPDLHQPIAMCFDDRGRLWVIEAYCYPRRHPHSGPVIPDAKLGDKILIFEDSDGDGKFDKKTTFIEGLNLASGIEFGFGGVWVGAAPYLMFIPILDGDKAGEPKILLDGWGYEDTHETLNSFIWGPDGWLYGCHGVFTHSKVGKPGTAADKRIPLNAGIWRYHPLRHTFEIFAHGTSNPWGLDYNQAGDFFIEACVIPHLWHIVQGGRYERQAGQHFNPYTYSQIGTIAKHRHYTGNQWNDRDRASSNDLGGGHAHSGLICYQGGLWPKEYHGKLFMGNIHGHRINVDQITPKGSSYEGDRNPDFLLSHDKTCIIVAIQAGPDGNVYFSDWSDKQVCHRNEPAIWDRTNGRVFKISHKDTKPVKGLDLQKLTNEELVKLQMSDNEWMVRHSRRILQERSTSETAGEIHRIIEKQSVNTESEKLRKLWALFVTGGLNVEQATRFQKDESPAVAGWAHSLAPSKSISDFESLLPTTKRHLIGARLRDQTLSLTDIDHLAHGIDWDDDPLFRTLFWNALEPLVPTMTADSMQMVRTGALRPMLEFVAKRLGAVGTAQSDEILIRSLANADVGSAVAILKGLHAGLVGRNATLPDAWKEMSPALLASSESDVRNWATSIGVAYRDPTAIQLQFTTAADTNASANARHKALNDVLDAGHNRSGGLLKQLIKEPVMRTAAIRGMARSADTEIPAAILAEYSQFTANQKRDAIATLASRATFATSLLDAVEKKAILSTELPAETVRQLRNLNDAKLNEQIAKVWGTVRETAADRKKLITDWTKKLNAPMTADLAHGRTVFAKVCQQCHTLYGVGGKVGPEITGSNRSDLNYLLENIFDPSAVIPKEYAATKLDLADGRVVTGIVQGQNATTVTVVTANETMQIPISQIEKRTPSELSMMPDDLTKTLSDLELKNLVAYLRHTEQVPMKATAENAKEFFNGKDLTGWEMDETAKKLNVWSVENGEIVGKSETGLKANTFLTSVLEASDFKLSLKMKLVPNSENSGVQIRSVRIEKGEMRGPQCDAGKGWWGKLYEESGRGLLWKEDAEMHVKVDDWNEYVIEAKGSTIKTWLNGKPCVNLTDDKLSKKGLIGLQVHSGKAKIEVRFKDLKLEVIEK